MNGCSNLPPMIGPSCLHSWEERITNLIAYLALALISFNPVILQKSVFQFLVGTTGYTSQMTKKLFWTGSVDIFLLFYGSDLYGNQAEGTSIFSSSSWSLR
jgi:hypothetical protein